MDELILRSLRGETSEFEDRQLQRWLDADAAHRERFDEARALLRVVDDAHEPAAGAPPPVDRVIALAEQRRRRSVERAGRHAFLRSRWFHVVAAATAVVAAGLISVLVLVRPAGAPAHAATHLTPVESSMGVGDVNTMALSDGSVIRTGPSSRLEFPAAAGVREVVLDGRAFFAVARAASPFVVRTRVGSATVRGTRFEISMAGDELRLVVVEGSVRLEGDGGGEDVVAGHVAWLRNGAPPRVVARDDVWDLLDWSSGLMIFQETPLTHVAREIGRHFGRSVQVTDEEIGGRRITAWFGDESIDEVVSAVCMIAGAHCSPGDTGITIERR